MALYAKKSINVENVSTSVRATRGEAWGSGGPMYDQKQYTATIHIVVTESTSEEVASQIVDEVRAFAKSLNTPNKWSIQVEMPKR